MTYMRQQGVEIPHPTESRLVHISIGQVNHFDVSALYKKVRQNNADGKYIGTIIARTFTDYAKRLAEEYKIELKTFDQL